MDFKKYFNNKLNEILNARTSSSEITKNINGKTITFYREDTFKQDRSLVYQIIKKIESGKIKLDIPDKHKSNITYSFILKLDNTLEFVKY